MTNVKGNFSINAEVSKVNKPNLISPRNPCYTDPIQQYFGQKGIQMNDSDEKTELPIQVIISASYYAQVNTKRNIMIGNRGEPVPQYTAFG